MTRRYALMLAAGAPLWAQRGPSVPAVRWLPHPVFNGAPVLFRSNTWSGSATWLGKEIVFRSDGEGFSALAGVNLRRAPGRYPLVFGNQRVLVPVTARAYRTSVIRVAPQFVEPPKEVLSRIEEERAVKRAVFSSSPPERRWQGGFIAPVNTRYTSSFGVRRTYNGKTQSVHQGLDFSADFGTEVRAANSGRVVVAREMYFEGGFVVIDHGESIFTLYMHLSEFLVHEGEDVSTGAALGKSGASGRVTGPHLHFAVQWQGYYLEPSTLLGLWPA
jgi:murein DD-endopeptidase MepM/ murein hydrolase activator NlpD